MGKQYCTVSGDTFDSIAYAQYGDETMADRLMKANMEKINYLVFPAGIILTIPSKDELADENRAAATDSPVWRKG